MYSKISLQVAVLALFGNTMAFSGRVFCDQGDAGISGQFAGTILTTLINSPGVTYGVPGASSDPAFQFTTGCLSTSQTGAQSCCQVAFLNQDGQQGTVTMTSNKASHGADALGGLDNSDTLLEIAELIFSTCWSDFNGFHSGRWAGQGELGDSGYQVGLSGGTC